MDWRDHVRHEPTANTWAALGLVRMALESVAPAGCLISEEAVLYNGPEPIHEGEVLAKAIILMAEKLTAD